MTDDCVHEGIVYQSDLPPVCADCDKVDPDSTIAPLPTIHEAADVGEDFPATNSYPITD